MSNVFKQLRHAVAELEIGVTDRSVDCPWCGGGSGKERSFAVTRTSEAEARYICHRASCGRAGRIAVWGFRISGSVPSAGPEAGKSFTPRLYTGETCELGEEWHSELLERYEISPDETARVGWRQELGSGLLVCPVKSSLGLLRGFEVRRSKVQVPHVQAPKTKSYRHVGDPWLGWYRHPEASTTALVEDNISALKVSRHFQAICIHGSHIAQDMLLEIIGVVGNKDVVVALDADATSKAINFIAKNRFLVPNFRAVMLSKDLKYSSDSDIVNILR
jgi:hypothetical protein